MDPLRSSKRRVTKCASPEPALRRLVCTSRGIGIRLRHVEHFGFARFARDFLALQVDARRTVGRRVRLRWNLDEIEQRDAKREAAQAG